MMYIRTSWQYLAATTNGAGCMLDTKPDAQSIYVLLCSLAFSLLASPMENLVLVYMCSFIYGFT